MLVSIWSVTENGEEIPEDGVDERRNSSELKLQGD
jgi:hypothetical protein